MVTPGMHYRTRYKAELSPRQREVLALIARGYTNAQIAQQLGLTLDGAKWHVSEILGKLEVDTREEAARYWRHEHSLTGRLGRALPGFGVLSWRMLAIAGGASAIAAAAVLAAVIVWVNANGGGPHSPAAAAGGTATARASATAGGAGVSPTAAIAFGTPVANPKIQSLHMISQSLGWATMERPGEAAVLRTVDGGSTWRSVFSSSAANATIAGSFFLSGQTAWVAIETPPAGGGLASAAIWRTGDGGRTWKQGGAVSGGVPAGLLTFSDANHGWYLESQGAGAGSEGVALYRTTDGGVHWTKLWATPPGGDGALPLGCIKAGLAFVNAERGWATGQCNGGEPFFYATQDGGATWQRASLVSARTPGSTLVQCQCALQPPQFSNAQRGFMAAVEDGEHVVYTTTDAGDTWVPTGAVPVTNGQVIYAFADAQHGWAATNAGPDLYVTDDGGATWRLLATPAAFGEGLAALQFTDALHGWALAWSGGEKPTTTLLRTSDGGVTWTAIAR